MKIFFITGRIRNFVLCTIFILIPFEIIIGQDLSVFSPKSKSAYGISLKETFNTDTIIYVFDKKAIPVYSLSIDARIKLQAKNSLVRLVLVDIERNEYLIYETYPLIAPDTVFSIKDRCEETALLDGVIPSVIKAYFVTSSITINNISIYKDKPPISDYRLQQKNLLDEQNKNKILQINNGIKKQGMIWVAGETSVSKRPYAEKKKMFGEKYNYQGFEFYSGGTFEYPSSSNTLYKSNLKTSGDVIESFDWRSKHGANNPNLFDGSPNPYYDGDNYWDSGWLTSVKDQGSAGTCWAFAAIGALEAQINLYFNDHIDVNLSEQMLVDCANHGIISELSSPPYLCENYPCYPGHTFCKILKVGVVDEFCDQYAERGFTYGENNCCNYTYICTDWASRLWKCTDFYDYKGFNDFGTPNCEQQDLNISSEGLKKIIIKKGLLDLGILSWTHAVVLCGYRTNVDEQTEWLIKNSWGDDWGIHGFAYLSLLQTDLDSIYATIPLGPFTPPIGQSYSVRCLDADKDGFANWGLGPRPSTGCPTTPSNEADGDDSTPFLGPMNENGYCADFINQDRYIQNDFIVSDRYIVGNNIYVGRSVTTSLPQGDVIINPGYNVIFDAQNEITWQSGFEVKLGGSLETK